MRVQVDGAQLHVHLRGPADAPPVLLLHGFPLSGAMWEGQLHWLAQKWRVIVPDLRGHGQSDVGDGQYAIDFFVDDVFAALDAVAPQRAVVGCGLSMGGYVLLRAVEREPERFSALVLADTRAESDPDAGRLKRLDAVRKIRKDGMAGYAEAFISGGLGKTTLAERPKVVDALRAIITDNSGTGMVGAQLAMAGRTDTTHILPTIKVPTLVVVGEEDTLTPPDVARAMADRIPGARYALIPQVGHMTPMEDPGAFNDALRAFLETL
jgi:pimeloyl-ACP methyl ester carboxylesterase